jgi:hypothetical protein
MRKPKRPAFFCMGIFALAVAAACGDSQRVEVGESTESTSSTLLSSEWTATVSMNAARQNHVAALLQNGSVLVAGGHPGSNTPTNSAEVFSPATGAWTVVGSMSSARRLFGACTLPSGKVLVAGGNAGAGDVTSAELFDPTTKTWSGTGSLVAAREDFSMTCLPDGRVLVAGGSGPSGLLNSAEIYSPATATWSSAGAMPAVVHTQGAVLLNDGRVLIAGGNNASGPVNTAAIWNPSTNAWTATGSMATSRAFFALNPLSDGRVLAAGGLVNTLLTTTNTAEVYSPITGTWSAAANLNTARYSGTSAALSTGPVVIGGVNGGSALATSESYDSVHNTWTQVATVYGAVNQTATALSPTSLLVAGGNTGSQATTSAQTFGTLNVFALYAQRSVTLGSSDHINGGDVGVATVAAPSFGPQLVVGASATVQTNHNLVAPSVSLASGAQVGDVQTNSLTNSGATLGTVAAYPSSMPSAPVALPTGSGGAGVSVPAFTITTLNPGNYGAVSISGTLYLNAGAYTFGSVTMANTGHLAGVSGTATVAVAGTFQAGNSVSITSPGSMPAGNLVVSVAGSDSGTTPAFSVGTSATVTAVLSAPHGTLSIGGSSTVTGAFAGFDVKLGTGVTVTFQNGFPQPSPCFGVPDGTTCGAGQVCASGACVVHVGGTPSGTPPRHLPPPPNVVGCYVGTWNGWLSVPCTPLNQLPPSLQSIPYIAGGEVTIPGYLNGGVQEYGPAPGVQTTDPKGLKYGQTDTVIVNIPSSTPTQPNEVNNCFSTEPGFCTTTATTPNTLSIQLNTNPFVSPTGPATFPDGSANGTSPGWVQGDQAWAQFTIQSSGAGNDFDVCVFQNDFTQGKNFTVASNNAYIRDCVQANMNSIGFATQGRGLQPLDFASVAGFAFPGADGHDDLGVVAQLSWWDPANDPGNFRGFYATVVRDLYGLGPSGAWKTASGTLLGIGGGSMAQFNSATVFTRVTAGNCATPTAGIGTGQASSPCQSTLPISGASESSQQFTDESNNLSVVPGTQLALALTSDGNSDLTMQYLAATGSSPQCDTTPHVFVKDYDQDNGSTPSNLGGQAFWESPDVVLVAAGGQPADTPITQVIAGQSYSIWIAAHNDYGCADVPGVTARVRFGDASLGSPTWTDIIANTSDNYSASPITVPRFASAFIGPIPWTAPQTADPHECLLADIKATGEAAPVNSTDTPGSNQVAQRNIEIGNDCNWTLTNGTGASGTTSITLKTLTGTSNGQPYTPAAGDVVQVMFSDPNGQTFASVWTTPPGSNPPYTVTNANNVTTVQLISTSFVSLPAVALASNQRVTVSSNVIPALFSGTTIDVQIGATLTNGGGTSPAVSNGASCQATATQGPPK